MACADECFACLAVLLEDGEMERIAAGLVRGRSARSCPEGQRGRKNADVGKLQIVVAELHGLFLAAWQRLEKPAMLQATMERCFLLADIRECRVRWGKQDGRRVLTFPVKVAEPPEEAAVCSSLRAAVNGVLEAVQPAVVWDRSTTVGFALRAAAKRKAGGSAGDEGGDGGDEGAAERLLSVCMAGSSRREPGPAPPRPPTSACPCVLHPSTLPPLLFLCAVCCSP